MTFLRSSALCMMCVLLTMGVCMEIGGVGVNRAFSRWFCSRGYVKSSLWLILDLGGVHVFMICCMSHCGYWKCVWR